MGLNGPLSGYPEPKFPWIGIALAIAIGVGGFYVALNASRNIDEQNAPQFANDFEMIRQMGIRAGRAGASAESNPWGTGAFGNQRARVIWADGWAEGRLSKQ